MAERTTIRRMAALGLIALALTGRRPARAADDPYGPIAAEDGICPENYAYSDRNDICVSQIGECAGQLWICRGHEHPQFRCDYAFKRPQRCCRKNWPPPADGSGKGKGLCHNWKPKPYCKEESK